MFDKWDLIVRWLGEGTRTPRWLLLAGCLVILGLLVLAWAIERENPVRVVPKLQAGFPSVAPVVAALTDSRLTWGNQVELIENERFLDRFLEEIDEARSSVHIETFIWAEGELTRRLREKLCAAASRGVEVRVLYDAVGGSVEGLAELQAAGAEVEVFRPLAPRSVGRLNHRDHRKLWIVDGRVAYVGGHGLSDQWLDGGADTFRDLGVRVTGPVLRELQGVFAQNWMLTTGRALSGPHLFPPLPETGESAVHVVAQEAAQRLSHAKLLYELAISAAREEIRIENPYFAPDDSMVEQLCRAAERGVDVQLMLPGPTDMGSVRHAGHYLLRPLLEAGVRIFEYQPRMLHQKVMTVDGVWCHVGSTNLDARSLELNDELSLGIVDPALARELRAVWERDAAEAKEIRLEDWRSRSLLHRGQDAVAALFREQL